MYARYTAGTYTGIRRATVGTDFSTKKVFLNDSEVVIQIWDTAGLERFHQGTLGNAFYRGAHGALIVYDATVDNSLEQIAQWRAELHSRVGNEEFPLVVVANKIDLKKIDVTPPPPEGDVEESGLVGCVYSIPSVVLWCQANKYGHIEASVKDNFGVDAAVRTLALLAQENMRSKKVDTNPSTSSRNPSVVLTNDFDQYVTKKRTCC